MSRAPLDDNGEPLLFLPHTQQPATPNVPSLVPDIDISSYNVSPAPPPQSRHYVHNTEPEFRHPTAPSNAASHWERRARDDNAGSRSSSPTKKSKVSESTFANSYREQLQRNYGGCCACEIRYYLHAAHVIDKAVAPDLSKLCRQGLVSLETLSDFDNAIYLCPADHAAFNARDPGLIIVPTHLDFFIDHERRWQEELWKTSPLSSLCCRYSGNSAQGDPAKNDQPPPPPSSGNPGAAGQRPYNPAFWNTLSLRKDTGMYPQIRRAKQQQADLDLGDNDEDTVRVAVSDADRLCKRAKPASNTGASSQRPPENRRQAYCWG